MLLERRDRIRTLRAVGKPSDPLAFRLALDRALGATDLHPAALPRDAVLCVRRLRAVMPPPGAALWAREVSGRIPDLIRQASRPFRENVSTTADVVVFFDEAELLACLARDWRAGCDYWWWQSIFGEHANAALVQRALLEAPTFVPAIMELLASAGAAADVVRALPPSYCDRLGQTVASTFAVPDWAHQDDRPPTGAGKGTDAGAPAPGAPRAVPPSVDVALAELMRAHDFLGLAPPQRALLGMALLLHRAPSVARLPGVVARIRDVSWLSDEGIVRSSRELRSNTTPSTPPSTRRGTGRRKTGALVDDVEPNPLQSDTITPPATQPVPTAVTARADGEPALQPVAEQVPAPAALPLPSESVLESPSDVFVVDSAFAGIVYLVNVAIHIGLYADFTQPVGTNLSLPLGDFLALIGERVCGTPFRDDRISELLARLSGGGRELEKDRRGDADASFDAWLDDLTAMLAARAASALGGVEQHETLAFLCGNAGTLALSSTRLDVTFPLAAHPLAIRLGGLDRDPGWVPAAGRVIAFHYE